MSYSDDSIRRAMDSGAFDNLPGAGKPLNLDKNPHAPDEWELAYKIMKDNDFAPEWIELGKQLRAEEDALRKAVRRAVGGYRQALAAAVTSPSPERQRAQAEADWARVCADLGQQVAAHNKKLLSFNLKVPPGIEQRALLSLDRELRKLGL
ncbi:MAG: DUF1992 domain-containing protein [Chloroflexi bacterium]|nr:DUF1992 domain-containing protein [Chloroflexota bacterium]